MTNQYMSDRDAVRERCPAFLLQYRESMVRGYREVATETSKGEARLIVDAFMLGACATALAWLALGKTHSWRALGKSLAQIHAGETSAGFILEPTVDFILGGELNHFVVDNIPAITREESA